MLSSAATFLGSCSEIHVWQVRPVEDVLFATLTIDTPTRPGMTTCQMIGEKDTSGALQATLLQRDSMRQEDTFFILGSTFA